MKKYFVFAAAALVALAMGFSSCKKNAENNAPGTSDGTSTGQELTPEQSKEKLANVASQLSAKFNTEDQKQAVELADGLYDKYEDYDFEGMADAFAKEFDKMMSMPRYAIGVLQGKRSPLMTTEESFQFNFTDYCLKFEADEANRTWINRGKTSDNSAVLLFKDNKGTQCEAKCQAQGEVKTQQVDVDGSIYSATLPAKVVFTLKQGSTEIIRMEAEQNIDVDAPSIELSTMVKVASIGWQENMKASKTSASGAYKFMYGSEDIISVAANMPSYKLIDKSSREDFDDWFENIAEQYDQIVRSIGSCDGMLDLMGMVQVKARINNAGQVYGAIYDWAQNEGYGKEYMQQLCDIINKGQDNGLYYDKTDTKQAEVRMLLREYYGDYEPMPVLYFPQYGSSYDFGQYFNINNGPFADMMSTFEDLANKYIQLARLIDPDLEDIHFTERDHNRPEPIEY